MTNKILLLLGMTAFAGGALDVSAQAVVDLGAASAFAVLAGAGVTSSGNSIVNGDLGSFPTATIAGFPSGIIYGTVHAGDATASQAQTDLTTAYVLLTGQSATVTNVSAFANETLAAGVYNSAATLGITGTVTLNGGGQANAVFVFQMGSTLNTALNSQIVLTNGAQAANVFWQVGSSATLGGSSTFVGNILANTSISLGSGASVDGRLLAMDGSVTMINNVISVPASAVPEPATTAILLAALAGVVVTGRSIRRRRTERLRVG